MGQPRAPPGPILASELKIRPKRKRVGCYSGADRTSSGPHSRTRSGVASMSSRNPNSASAVRTSSALCASQRVNIRSSWRSGDQDFSQRGDGQPGADASASSRKRVGGRTVSPASLPGACTTRYKAMAVPALGASLRSFSSRSSRDAHFGAGAGGGSALWENPRSRTTRHVLNYPVLMVRALWLVGAAAPPRRP
jgi:hypothetical protein